MRCGRGDRENGEELLTAKKGGVDLCAKHQIWKKEGVPNCQGNFMPMVRRGIKTGTAKQQEAREQEGAVSCAGERQEIRGVPGEHQGETST